MNSVTTRRITRMVLSTGIALLAIPIGAFAQPEWDYVYRGDVMPEDSPVVTLGWDSPDPDEVVEIGFDEEGE